MSDKFKFFIIIISTCLIQFELDMIFNNINNRVHQAEFKQTEEHMDLTNGGKSVEQIEEIHNAAIKSAVGYEALEDLQWSKVFDTEYSDNFFNEMDVSDISIFDEPLSVVFDETVTCETIGFNYEGIPVVYSFYYQPGIPKVYLYVNKEN